MAEYIEELEVRGENYDIHDKRLDTYTTTIIADCNNMSFTFGKTNSSTLNTPYKEGLTTFSESLIITSRYGSAMATYTTQLSITSGSGVIYRRYKNTGDWSSWEKLTTESDIYYKSGDSVKVRLWTTGVLTTSKTQIYFTLPSTKQFYALGLTTSFNLTKFHCRHEGFSYTDMQSAVTETQFSLTDSPLQIYCRFIFPDTTFAAIENNSVVGIFVEGTLTFSSASTTSE